MDATPKTFSASKAEREFINGRLSDAKRLQNEASDAILEALALRGLAPERFVYDPARALYVERPAPTPTLVDKDEPPPAQ